MKKLVAVVTRALVWARSAEGRKDLGALIAAVTAIYTAFHRAGI